MLNNKLTFLFVCLGLLFCKPFYSQNLHEFEYLGDPYGANELYLGLYPTFSMVSNSAAPNPSNHKLNGWSGEISLRKVNFDQGKLRWSWQQKMFVDVVLLLNEALIQDESAINRKVGTGLSCGPLGWIDLSWNLLDTNKKHQVSLGINHNDYFYASTFDPDTSTVGVISPEPQGYYLAAGPSVIVNYLFNEYLMAELSTSYSFSYVKPVDLDYAYNPDPNYPKPHWGQIDLELQSKWGFFTGFNYNWIINRGDIPAKGKRFDLLVGFRFMW